MENFQTGLLYFGLLIFSGTFFVLSVFGGTYKKFGISTFLVILGLFCAIPGVFFLPEHDNILHGFFICFALMNFIRIIRILSKKYEIKKC